MSVGGLFVGLATLDVVQLVDRMPRPNQKTIADQSWLAAGGPAAVAAIAFAALGGRARLWTALGATPAARLVAADLASAGVEVIDVAPPGFELAASTVLLDGGTGDRAVVSGAGHVPRFGKIAGPDLSGMDVILLDGHHAALARSAALAASPRPEEPRGTRGVTKDIPVVIDAGSHKPVFDEVLPLASDVICSADYIHPAGLPPEGLRTLGPRLIAVSHGSEPLEWRTADSSGTVTPPPAKAVDTVGAGDVLHGAYCFFLASGLDRVPALERAVATAAERVRHLGPFAWRTAIA
jgi:sugar/nucleoside kinase (ribokinase family)